MCTADNAFKRGEGAQLRKESLQLKNAAISLRQGNMHIINCVAGQDR